MLSAIAGAALVVPLREDFAFLLDAARLQREWIRAYFAMRLYMEDTQEEYRMWCKDALLRLVQIEATPDITLGLDLNTGRRYNIDRFVLEMRWRMATAAEPGMRTDASLRKCASGRT